MYNGPTDPNAPVGIAVSSLTVLFVSALAWLLLVAAEVSDQSLGDVFGSGAVATVLASTRFGHVWLANSRSLDIAKRMQRAYNFENDVQRTIIKPDYMSQSVKGMLAADTLGAAQAMLAIPIIGALAHLHRTVTV